MSKWACKHNIYHMYLCVYIYFHILNFGSLQLSICLCIYLFISKLSPPICLSVCLSLLYVCISLLFIALFCHELALSSNGGLGKFRFIWMRSIFLQLTSFPVSNPSPAVHIQSVSTLLWPLKTGNAIYHVICPSSNAKFLLENGNNSLNLVGFLILNLMDI